MKKHGVLNSEIASILASLGHTDTIVIADCGLPIPDGVKRIDLAVEIGKPSFLDVLQVVADDMAIEKVTLAEEVINNNAEINKEIELKLVEPAFEYVSHEQFKEHTKKAYRRGYALCQCNFTCRRDFLIKGSDGNAY